LVPADQPPDGLGGDVGGQQVEADGHQLLPVRWVPVNRQMTMMLARASMPLSRPEPSRATDPATTAADGDPRLNAEPAKCEPQQRPASRARRSHSGDPGTAGAPPGAARSERCGTSGIMASRRVPGRCSTPRAPRQGHAPTLSWRRQQHTVPGRELVASPSVASRASAWVTSSAEWVNYCKW
jgi:hypothetical protein